MAQPMLRLNNVEVIYDDVILVLKGLSLEVPKGQIVALLGSNGAGNQRCMCFPAVYAAVPEERARLRACSGP